MTRNMHKAEKHIFLHIVLTAAAISLAAPNATALNPSYYATDSRLASPGHWVKVKVTETGLHRISYGQLREWGFDDPSKVNVYGFGGPELYDNNFSTTAPDDLPLQYSEHANEALLFYGEGDIRLRPRPDSDSDIIRRRNHYSTFSCYFLSDADLSQKQPAENPLISGGESVDEHLSFDYREPEEFRPYEAGVFWFANPLTSSSDKRSFVFDAEDFTGQAAITYLPVSNLTTSATVIPSIDTGAMSVQSRNLTAVRPVTSDRTYLIYNSLPSPSNLRVKLNNGHTAFPVTFTGLDGDGWVSIDYVCMIYHRRNRLASHAQLTLNLCNASLSDNIRITEATADTRVWDVTSPTAIRPLATGFDSDNETVTVSPATAGAATLVAFNPSSDSFPVPEFAGTVTGGSNLHGEDADADMLIITNSSLLPAANRLAELHTLHQGLTVKITDHERIFDEFSSGAPSAIAYRRYVKMLHDRNPGRLKYLLLLGHGTSDHRFITLENDGSYLFTYQVEEDRELGYTDWSNYRVSNFSSDNYFGMLDDGFTIRNISGQRVNIGVGRIPVAGISQANQMIDKIEDYLNTYLTEDYHSRMLSLADGGDGNAHLAMAESGVDIMHSHQPHIAADKVYHALFRTTTDNTKNIGFWKSRLDEGLAEGVGFMGYCGHAANTSLATGFTYSSIADMVFGNHPICFLATCESLYIDRSSINMGTRILNDPRGAVALISAGRTVYLNRNKAIYDAFTDSYFGAAAGDCLGDAWRKGFNKVMTTPDQSYGINTLCYNLGGDPALPIARPTHSATVNTVNGNKAAAVMRVTAQLPVVVSGVITNSDGNIATDFNGKAIITLYDGQQTITTPQSGDDASVDVEVDNRLLTRTGTEVKNGVWTATIVPPIGNVAGSTNRLLIWATDGESRMAMGDYTGLSLSDPADVQGSAGSDTTGPEIIEMYLDTSSFTEGDAVASDFTLHAIVGADPSGVDVGNSSVSRRPRVSLDGTSATTMVSNTIRWQADGSAEIVYPFSGIADGHHSLSLTVADNRGNTTERTIEFAVAGSSLPTSLTITDPIVTGSATIDLDKPASAEVKRVIVRDASYNTVATHTNISWPWKWTPDKSMPDGHYTITAFIEDGTRKGATPPLEITLIRER